jgi:site-specific DNA-cytosine methylase
LPWQGASGNAENCLDSRSYAVGINGDIAGTLDANYYKGCGMRQGVEREVVASVAYSIENHPADSRVNIDYSGKVQTLTSRMGTGGGNVPMVMERRNAPNVVDVEMEVAVRKYEVDRDRLIELLRSHKGSFTNAQIAEALHRPLTLVEHWFRKDACFAVPDPDIWFRLKRLLGIETTEFDACITEYEFKGGNYDMRNRIYTGDIAPTLTGGCGNHLHLVSELERAEESYIVRRLTPTECARLQGFPDDWGHIEEKDSFTPEELAFWQEVRNTHAAVTGRVVKEYTEKQMLTWYNRLHTDSAEYKMWGNGIALPTALYCMQGIAEALKQ